MGSSHIRRFDLWKLSLLNVFSSPVRSMLTVLGFAIGVAAVLAVLTLGEAGKTQVEAEMGRLGIDKVWISSRNEEDIPKEMGSWVGKATGSAAEELVYLPVTLKAPDGAKICATMIGCSWSYIQSMAGDVCVNAAQWNTQEQSALIGEKLASDLIVQFGNILSIENRPFQICGIMSKTDSFASVPLDEAILVPLHVAAAWTEGTVHEIQLSPENGVSVEKLQKHAQQLLKTQNINVVTSTMQVQMDAAQNVIKTFVNVLKWVALVCVLVGGIGIMNILLISIRERKREIGVMKSLGTASRQICILFLEEAVVYAATGGFAGLGFGVLLIRLAGASIELNAQANLADCTMVFMAAVGVGLFFGVWPAFQASHLKCVDALKQE